MPHTAATVHEHSRAAHAQSLGMISRRAAQVLAWVREHGRATDRQVMAGLGFQDPNAVRPRVTELVQLGALREVGSTRCPVTGKTVRLVDVPAGQGSLFS